jgi:hypothetical protein
MRCAIVVIASSIALAGCASQEANIGMLGNGKLYLYGDNNCVKGTYIEGDKLQCFTQDNKPTDIRNPIPTQQAEAYNRMRLQNQAEQAQETQQLVQSMQQFHIDQRRRIRRGRSKVHNVIRTISGY